MKINDQPRPLGPTRFSLTKDSQPIAERNHCTAKILQTLKEVNQYLFWAIFNFCAKQTPRARLSSFISFFANLKLKKNLLVKLQLQNFFKLRSGQCSP